ncbi:(S)-coclaurine N-methyltransferase-like [Curcuma longa]|uniref:(S)-coclaurine N-methyltransferase-like n=1 Tax=Curcuma longa TaxID=136217 RepID=UPI003D9F5A0A
MEAIVRMLYEAAVRAALVALERNLLPDALVRRLTRLLLARRLRLRLGYQPTAELQLEELVRFSRVRLKPMPASRVKAQPMPAVGLITSFPLEDMPIAVDTDKAKSQHYELPTSFFKLVLGQNLKYSCCYFKEKTSRLEDAENAMLELYCERAQLKDGQNVLDIGCGWGSFSIYVAKKYKNCEVTGICNSSTQKAYIEEQCRHLELPNVEIIVANISNFEMEASFDRIVSIGMFEHMKNYKELLKKISLWMKEDSLFFIQHFCHKTFAYHFEDDVTVLNHWLLNGSHYARTS